MARTLEQQHAELKRRIEAAKAEKRGVCDLEQLLKIVTNKILARDLRKAKGKAA